MAPPTALESYPPPPPLRRQPTNSNELYNELTTPDYMSAFHRALHDYNAFGLLRLTDPSNPINTRAAGFYVDIGSPSTHHLSIHSGGSTNAIGSLHVRQNDGARVSKRICIMNTPHNIEIAIYNENDGSQEADIARRIVQVLIYYYKLTGRIAVHVDTRRCN
jgi:hypothetical protein